MTDCPDKFQEVVWLNVSYYLASWECQVKMVSLARKRTL